MILLAASAMAQIAPDPRFKDWFSLSAALRASGIDPAGVNWLAIEPMCLSLKTEYDQAAYNQCKYAKARDAVAHGTDATACAQEAEGAYPNSLRLKRATQSAVIVEGRQPGTLIEGQFPGISAGELKNLRRAYISRCMRASGWQSANDWQLGRRDGE